MSNLLNPKRLPGESFWIYKIRRKAIKDAGQEKARGRLIWDSKKHGTVRIREHATPDGIDVLTDTINIKKMEESCR